MLGRRSGPNPVGTCWKGHHVVQLEHLRLQSPTRSDMVVMSAAASDPAAQRWLGWPRQSVVRESRRESVLARHPGQGRRRAVRIVGKWYLIAIDRTTGLAAGGVGGDIRDGDVGGWLAPQYRGRRLGAELFAGAAQFAHYHLGQEHVFAGAEPANVASIRALLSAEFSPTAGPEVHQLPDGRLIPASWFHHATNQATRCQLLQ